MEQTQSLQNRKCTPCNGSTPALDARQAKALAEGLAGWRLMERRLEKEFKFKTFREALAFVNRVGELAESEGHHPDLSLHDYNRVTVALWTHAVGGLSENDFILAAKIEAGPKV